MKRSLQKTTSHIFNYSVILLPVIYLLVMLISFFEINLMTIVINIFCVAVVFFALFLLYELKEKKIKYKFWHYLYLFFFYPSFLILCFSVYSFYWFEISHYISFVFLASQVFVFLLGYFLGFIRLEVSRQKSELRKSIKLIHRTNEKLEKGVIYLKENSHSGSIFFYKKSFDNLFLEMFFRIFQYGYIVILGLGLFLGSGSSLIVIRVIDSYLPLGMNISSHHIAMYGFSLLVIPILAYYLPAIISAIRWWKNLEADIQQRYGKVVYVWPDEQISTPTEESKSS